MSSTLELCEKYFGTRDIYKLMNLTKNALEKDVKKAYYRLSLQVHPDRVAEADKEEATEKFKILTKINTVLTDPNKKAIYDEQGIIDDDGETDLTNYLTLWRQFFKPIAVTDIEKFEKEYVGSAAEERDIRKAYMGGKGCLNYMMDSVPFMTIEDEPRIIELVKGWIANGELPEYKQFVDEPKAKRARRHKKYAREAQESEKLKRDMEKKTIKENDSNLQVMIMKRQAERESAANNFFDKLLEKYGDGDDSDDYVLPAKKFKKTVAKKTVAKKTVAKKTNNANGKTNKKSTSDGQKDSLNKVKSGRVKKTK